MTGLFPSVADPEAYRHELRGRLEAALTDEVRAALDSDDERRFDAHRRWSAALVDAGHGAVSWPVEFGGRDAGITV